MAPWRNPRGLLLSGPPNAPDQSISTPGLRIPAGSSAGLAARSARANSGGRSRSYQGRCSLPTAWWCVMVAPLAASASEAARLISALLQLGAPPPDADERVIRRRSVGVDMREAAAEDPAVRA